MMNLWNREPVAILTVVSAGLALGIGFGAHITTEQMGLIMAFVSAVLGLITRQTVTSPATLDRLTPSTLSAAQSTIQPVRETIKKLPVIVFACVLAGSSFGCAKARHLAVVADASFAKAVFAVDDLEYKACQVHTPPFTVAVCEAANPKIKQALLDVKAVTQALIVAPKSGALPKDFPSLIANLTAVQAMLSPLAPSVIKNDVAAKIQQALMEAVGILSAFTETK